MRPHVLDTNLYIRATRDEQWARELETFSTTYAPALHVHSVVAMELLAGATSAALRRRTHEGFIRPFERRRRVITPGHETWKRAGGIIAELLSQGRRRRGQGTRSHSEWPSPSFVNDCLLAASAQEHGFVLVTANVRDFERIGHVARFDWVKPWPVP